MSTSSASVLEKDLRSQENLRYSRPYHRMRKVARVVNRLPGGKACRLVDVGCGLARVRMLLDPSFTSHGIDMAMRQPALGLVRSTSGITVPGDHMPSGNIQHSAAFRRNLAEDFAVEKWVPTAHNASCRPRRPRQRLPLRVMVPRSASVARGRRGEVGPVLARCRLLRRHRRPAVAIADRADAPFSEHPTDHLKRPEGMSSVMILDPGWR